MFDELGRVTDIVHERAATEFADYDLTWDAVGRISDFDFDSLVGNDGDVVYSYDDTNQLTGSDYASDWQDDESYVYDDNGNRTLVDGSTSFTTGDHNRLTSDGTFSYTYDNEGNVLTKTNISTSESVEYTWDHRNRLTMVTFKNSGGTPTEIVEYAYDHGQRWVRKTLDTNADGTIEESRMFVHDNGQIVLDFEKAGTAAASNSDLAHRYLWGNSVDQLLADETIDDGSEDDVAYVLGDHLNSVRDLVVYDPVTQTVSVVKHVAYDAFGNVTSDSATGVKSLFLYTARPFDADTDLQNNLNRWYDPSTGRWLSVDPVGFEAEDVNLYGYVENGASWRVDPRGLAPPDDTDQEEGVGPIFGLFGLPPVDDPVLGGILQGTVFDLSITYEYTLDIDACDIYGLASGDQGLDFLNISDLLGQDPDDYFDIAAGIYDGLVDGFDYLQTYSFLAGCLDSESLASGLTGSILNGILSGATPDPYPSILFLPPFVPPAPGLTIEPNFSVSLPWWDMLMDPASCGSRIQQEAGVTLSITVGLGF